MNTIRTQIIQKYISINFIIRGLIILWLASSIFMSFGYIKQIVSVQIFGIILGIAYTLVLVWHLFRSEPLAIQPLFSDSICKRLPNSRWVGVSIAILVLIIIFLTTIVLRDGWRMLLISVPLSILIIIIYRKSIRKKYVLASFGVLVILAFVEQLLGSEMSSGLIIPIGSAFIFLAGILLLQDMNLSRVRSLDEGFVSASKSFISGCVLAVPASLINILSMQLSPPSQFDLLFDGWWEPLYAFQPGILEEIWARLFLIPLLYILLQPNKKIQPLNAMVFAVVMAAFIHAAAHYPGSITNPIDVIYITLIYGIPLGVIFIKRDLEQAIAYHFFIDLIRFSVYYITNTAL